mgnify:CR=1 FL=1
MREQRLLERIASLEQSSTSPSLQRSPEQIVMDSIRSHLQRLLNTRQGSVPIDPDFGVPDFTNLAGSFSVGSMPEIVHALTRMIERYEPRLIEPKITVAESDNEVLSLSFQLEAYIKLRGQHINIRLATQVSASGKVSLYEI